MLELFALALAERELAQLAATMRAKRSSDASADRAEPTSAGDDATVQATKEVSDR